MVKEEFKFSESKVEYASHQLSLYYGECPHKCSYCFVNNYRKRGYSWAMGELRVNQKAFSIAKEADTSKVTCLVVSFTNDPFPISYNEDVKDQRLASLKILLDILEARKIPTKVLTKNAQIEDLLDFQQDPYKYIQIGFSITTNPDNAIMRARYEPFASSIDERITALELFQVAGFKTWVSVEPILPNTQILDLLYSLNRIGVEEIWVGKTNYDPFLSKVYNWEDLLKQVKFMQKQIPSIQIKHELASYEGKLALQFEEKLENFENKLKNRNNEITLGDLLLAIKNDKELKLC